MREASLSTQSVAGEAGFTTNFCAYLSRRFAYCKRRNHMNKKFLSFALSGMFALSAVFGIAACKPQNGGGAGGNNGNNNENNNGGGNNNNNNLIEPGTVITDETVKKSIFSALSEAKTEGLTYSASLNISATTGTASDSQKISLEGAIRMDESVEGDAYISIDGSDGLLYFLGFLRESGAYCAMGEAEGKTVDFSALKTQLKAEQDPIVLEKAEAGVLPGILAAPATVKILKNATSLIDGVITKTEGGYSLSFDLVEGAGDLLEGAQAVADAIDKTAEMTLTGFFSQKFVDDTLTTLLNGVTAEELSGFFELLPEKAQSLLPAPGKETAKEYLLGLLRSGSFYASAVGEGEPWSSYKTFGEVPLAQLLSFVTDGDVELGSLKLKEMLSELTDSLQNKIVSLFIDLISIEGTVTDEELELSVTFSFDDNKKLLGLALDALAGGNVTENAEEQQPDGGTTPENGSGDEMKTAAAPMTKVHFALKMNMTCTQSPELFDLKGCKFEGENGAGTIG